MSPKRIALPLLLGAFLAVGVYTLNFARAKHVKPASSQSNQTVPFKQEITSCVKGVKVVKAEITNAGTPDARVRVQIENVSDLGIIAVSLEVTNGIESYMTTLRSSFTEQKPMVVIKPHETGILAISLSGIFNDVPLQLGGAIYENGTEEGCQSSLQTLHEIRTTEQKKRSLTNEAHPPDPYPSSH